jgi:DNA polymerase III alpha subunit (gram-positive type)
MKTQIMLDLETLGNTPGSVIVSLGACTFSNGKIVDEFYERINAGSCAALGLHLDASTVVGWMGQNDHARAEIQKPGGQLRAVLSKFSAWASDPNACVWGNGATFDNVLLSVAYTHAGLTRPWKYSNDRCYRTVKALYPETKIDRIGTFHNAIDDAKSQALHLMEIIKRNNIKI